MGFSELVKCTFWLVEAEERVKGNNPPHSWKGLAKSIKDKKHIIHDTLRYRLNKPKDKRLREKYFLELKRYLAKLERTING